MGTHGLLGHIVGGKKKAAYNHLDSYPSGLGVKLVAFIKALSESQIAQMKVNLEQLEWLTRNSPPPSKDVQERYVYAGFLDIFASPGGAKSWHRLLDNVEGAKALPHILDGSLRHLVDYTDGKQDCSECEWIYYVDWDTREVHVDSDYMPHATKGFAELSKEWMLSLQDVEMRSRKYHQTKHDFQLPAIERMML